MNKYLNFIVLFYVGMFLTNCQDNGKLKFLADLPSSLSENSGIESFNGKTIWLIEDSGNNDNIFKVDFEGKIVKHLDVKNAKNKDWEDLTQDAEGNLYIGDFGNNNNDRDNLVVYKLPNPEIEKGDKIAVEEINFHYPEQTKFPPKKSKFYYDTEAFFHWGKSLYLITKNRTRPYDGKAMIYKIPDSKGNHKAQKITTWTVCKDQDICSVTSAAIAPNGKTIAVLSYGLLWIISEFEMDNFTNGTIEQIDLRLRTQLESVCFLNDTTLLLSDERSHHQGGNLYSLDLKSL